MMKMKLHELDAWYRDNEMVLDDFMRLKSISWGALTYEKRLAIYEQYRIEVEDAATRSEASARGYHASPNVIAYFKAQRLNHESGDFRPLWKKLAYALATSKFNPRRPGYMALCRLNNLHRT